jgi:hypothetical protein
VLLAAFVAGPLGVVEAVAWLGRTGSAWVVAAAVALMLALLARLSLDLGRILDGQARARAGRVLGAVTVVALVTAAVPFGGAAVARARDGAPEATVRGYLTAAAVDGDGVSGCRYLSQRTRAQFERASGQTCDSFFGDRTVRIGGEAIDSNAQLAAAHYTVTTAGRDRLVTMTYAGQSIRFRLAPATTVERQEYLAPPTPWRIASGVQGVV